MNKSKVDKTEYKTEKETNKKVVQWQDLNWVGIEEYVFKLQTSIYRATKAGNVEEVRKIQNTILQSWRARCLAVRKVTQDNQGKKTAGVDGIKNITPLERLKLVEELKQELKKGKSKPIRRVFIPKPGKDEKRPLGIPVMKDRALQALYKLALEPEWEAKFEPNSYGFRPGRRCQDAIQAIFNQIRYEPKYILDADISKCFDKINHEALLEKMNTSPGIRRQVKSWLKAGVMDKGKLYPTEEGTPQGGVISPLLANIALHGMEETVKEYVAKRKTWNRKISGRDKKTKSVALIRYADDFVIIHESLEVIKKLKQVIEEWLSTFGLTIQPTKTKIVHSKDEYEGEKPGLDFLGFNIRQFETGVHTSGHSTHGELLGFTTIIQPSKEAINRHYQSLAEVVGKGKALTQEELIKALNPKIQGWSNYYKYTTREDARETLRFRMHRLIIAWAGRRHSNKTWGWIKRKYWQKIGKVKWNFCNEERTVRLKNHFEGMENVESDGYVKVRGEKSPYDGDKEYWSKRVITKYNQSREILLIRQDGKCSFCEEHFKPDDLTEIDHIKPKVEGGGDSYDNLQLVHRHCHDLKTAREMRERKLNR